MLETCRGGQPHSSVRSDLRVQSARAAHSQHPCSARRGTLCIDPNPSFHQKAPPHRPTHTESMKHTHHCTSVPGLVLSKPLLHRRQGEPVRAVALPTAAFVANRRGYPTLPRAHKDLLVDFWRQGVQVGWRGARPPACPPHPPVPAAAPRAPGGASSRAHQPARRARGRARVAAQGRCRGKACAGPQASRRSATGRRCHRLSNLIRLQRL